MFKFQSLVSKPISAGRSWTPSLPDRLSTDRFTNSLIVTGTLRTLLLLTSNMLKLQNISLDFWVTLESEQLPLEGDGAVANTAEVVEVDETEVVVVFGAGNNSNV